MEGTLGCWCTVPGRRRRRLDLGPRESAIPLANYSDRMDAAGVAYERLDAGEIVRRWPQWRLDESIHGLFQAEGGIAMAAKLYSVVSAEPPRPIETLPGGDFGP